MAEARSGAASWAIVEATVRIRAPLMRVWTALVTETAAWWRGAFLTTGPESRFVIEPRPGGRLFEDAGGDDGLLWAIVTVLDAPVRLEFAGDISPTFGGPVRSQVSIGLAEDGREGIVVTLSDAIVGNVTDSLRNALSDGWHTLLGMLRDHVERDRTR